MTQVIAADLKINTGETVKSVKSAQQELRGLLRELTTLEEGSKEFTVAAQRAGALRDQIGDINQRVNFLANDTQKLAAFTDVASGIAGGFAAAQGAAALFGGENEELLATLTKVQGSLAVLQGVQAAANTLNKDSAASVFLNVQRQRAYALAVGTSTGALKAFRLALVATGIGAAVVALGLLVANWDKLTKAVTGFIEKSPALTKVIGFITRGFERIGQAIGVLPSDLEKAINEEIVLLEKQKKLLEAAGADTEALSIAIAKKRVELAKETGEGIEEAEEELTLATVKQIKARDDAAKKSAEENAKLQAEAYKKRREDLQKQLDEFKAIEAEATEAQRAAAQKAVDELAAIDEKRRQDGLSATEKRIDEIQLESDRRIELLRETGASELEIIQEQNAAKIAAAKVQADEEARINAEKAKKIADDEKALREGVVNVASASFGSLSQLAATFTNEQGKQSEKAFKISKGLAIAQAVVDTYASAQSAFKSLAGIPGVGPVLGGIAAGAAVIAGLARVRQIRQTQLGSANISASAGGGASFGSTSGNQQPTSAPQPFEPPVRNGTPTQGGNNSGNLPNQNETPRTIRAFVVESERQAVSNRLAQAENLGTLR